MKVTGSEYPQPPEAGEVKEGLYHHWKGGEYRVIGVALNRDSNQKVVVYRPTYGDMLLEYKPLEEFTETVVRGNYNCPRYFWVNE
jgi:hypothetical protein